MDPVAPIHATDSMDESDQRRATNTMDSADTKDSIATPSTPRPSSDVPSTHRNDLGDVDALDPDCVLMMRTSQTSQFRLLMDYLKDISTEVQFKFSPDGLKVISLDPVKIALISMHVKTEFFYCPQPITAGINVTVLYKLLRNLTSAGYMLELSMSSKDMDLLTVQLSNSDKRTKTTNKLRLLRLPDEVITIPNTTFNRVLSIPSSDFQRYVRELSSLSNKITISSTRDELTLSASGNLGSSEITIRPTSSGLHWQHKTTAEDDEVISGTFFSRYLERLTKPLDSLVDLYIRPNYPIVLRFCLSLATVRIVIAPVNETEEDT